jgi:polyribonucleotide 5'-hydroxyl-kinase
MAGSLRFLDHVSHSPVSQDSPKFDVSLGRRTKVDTAKRKFELLTPSPGKLPSRVALVGSVEWIEVDD